MQNSTTELGVDINGSTAGIGFNRFILRLCKGQVEIKRILLCLKYWTKLRHCSGSGLRQPSFTGFEICFVLMLQQKYGLPLYQDIYFNAVWDHVINWRKSANYSAHARALFYFNVFLAQGARFRSDENVAEEVLRAFGDWFKCLDFEKKSISIRHSQQM